MPPPFPYTGLRDLSYDDRLKECGLTTGKQCVQAWRPYLQQDINNIEGVQRRMTKMMREVEEEEYEQRLKKTKLMSLEMRRLRSDLIEVYKIMHNLEGLEREDFFPLRSAGRRGHRYTITKQYSRLNSRKYFFSQRVVDQWNRLPTTTVCAETINRFKNQIDPICYGNTGGSL